MSTALNVNGIVYNYPTTGDSNWGDQASLWATAVTNSILPRNGGLYSLTGEVSFGNSFGIVSSYYKSITLNASSTGIVRLARTDSVSWRNTGNTADLSLGVNNSNVLTFNGLPLGGATGALGNQVFYENDQTVTADYTLTAGKQAGTFGPVSINTGVTVTVPDNATWSIV